MSKGGSEEVSQWASCPECGSAEDVKVWAGYDFQIHFKCENCGHSDGDY